MNIGDGGHPARSNHRQRRRHRERHGRFDIDALQHAITANIGEKHRGDAGVFETLRQIGDRQRRHIGPTTSRHHAVTRVDSDDDAARMILGQAANQIGIVQSGGAHHHAPHTRRQPAFHVRGGADAATNLNLAAAKPGQRRLHASGIAAVTGERTIQIDNMQMRRARGAEQCCLRRRVVSINRGAVHVAFGQPHALAALQIDGGKNNHDFSQLERNASP